jgi:hypothetical protein
VTRNDYRRRGHTRLTRLIFHFVVDEHFGRSHWTTVGWHTSGTPTTYGRSPAGSHPPGVCPRSVAFQTCQQTSFGFPPSTDFVGITARSSELRSWRYWDGYRTAQLPFRDALGRDHQGVSVVAPDGSRSLTDTPNRLDPVGPALGLPPNRVALPGRSAPHPRTPSARLVKSCPAAFLRVFFEGAQKHVAVPA